LGGSCPQVVVARQRGNLLIQMKHHGARLLKSSVPSYFKTTSLCCGAPLLLFLSACSSWAAVRPGCYAPLVVGLLCALVVLVPVVVVIVLVRLFLLGCCAPLLLLAPACSCWPGMGPGHSYCIVLQGPPRHGAPATPHPSRLLVPVLHPQARTGAQKGQVCLPEKDLTAEELKKTVQQMNAVLDWYANADEVFDNKQASSCIRFSRSSAGASPSSGC
jgi:hypothetical protein